jgi:GMP synthase (glutamine-hydrolysing)
MSDILILQHAAAEGPAAIGESLSRQGLGTRILRIDRGDPVPDSLDGAAGLVVMGGPMGVYETERYPHLVAELRLIKRCLREEKPILGICLGSQLLASALGARVYSSGRKEIGWFDVTLRKEARSDPLWVGLPGRFKAFHWHGDVFDLPEGAVSLASSRLTPQQAFRWGSNCYGILFHLEINASQVSGMARDFAAELVAADIPVEGIARGIQTWLPGVSELGAQVFDRWARMLRPVTSSPRTT